MTAVQLRAARRHALALGEMLRSETDEQVREALCAAYRGFISFFGDPIKDASVRVELTHLADSYRRGAGVPLMSTGNDVDPLEITGEIPLGSGASREISTGG